MRSARVAPAASSAFTLLAMFSLPLWNHITSTSAGIAFWRGPRIVSITSL